MEFKRSKAESAKKEIDKEVVRVKHDMLDLKVGSEEYANACKSISSLADASLKYNTKETNWAGVLVPAGCSIAGVTIMAIAEYTHVVEGLIRKWNSVKSIFRK